MGSSLVAAWIAHLAFWGLLASGLLSGAITFVRALALLVLLIAGGACLRYVPYEPAHAMFSSYVAVLDIALVFLIFKGDVRLT